MPLLKLDGVYEAFLDAVQRHEAARLEAVVPVSRVAAATAAAKAEVGGTAGGTGRIPGRVQIANLVRLLDRLGYTRSATQKEIHKGMVASVLPRIFRHESDSEVRVAMTDYGLKETSQQFMVLCPRRHGKTIATALFIAAYLLSIPTCTVSVYSTARRASQELLNLIKKMVNTLPMAKSFESISNQETYEITINGDKRRCSSYPGCSRTLRGTGGDLIVLEEAAYIDEAVFNEVVIPLLEIEVTSVIAISTPSTQDNYYSKLMSLKTKRGDPVFSVFTAKRMCAICAAEGRDSCPHIEAEKAPWKSGGKREIVEALYGANTTLAKRELQGDVTDDLHAAYASRMVQATFDAPRVRLEDAMGGKASPNVIYVAIDPSGGGASKFSMVSLSLYQLGTRIGDTIQSAAAKRPRLMSAPSSSLRGGDGANAGKDQQAPVGFLVHGMENEPIQNRCGRSSPSPHLIPPSLSFVSTCSPPFCFPTRRDHVWATVLGHIRNLRKRHTPSDALICVGVESNLGNEASHIAHMLRGEENLICLAEGKNGKSGFCTTNPRKHEYFSLLEMAMAEGCLQFVEDLVCDDPVACMIELKHQITSFKRVAPNQQSAFSERKVTFSGKVDGTGAMASHRLCDDLVLSLQMAMFVSTLVYRQSPPTPPPSSRPICGLAVVDCLPALTVRRNSISFPYSKFKTL